MFIGFTQSVFDSISSDTAWARRVIDEIASSFSGFTSTNATNCVEPFALFFNKVHGYNNPLSNLIAYVYIWMNWHVLSLLKVQNVLARFERSSNRPLEPSLSLA
jgi:hypothetical protein